MQHPDDVIDITFISRKPYLQFVEHKFMGRQVTNENELMKRMNALPGVKATLVDFATITFQEQIHLVTNTDIMVRRASVWTSKRLRGRLTCLLRVLACVTGGHAWCGPNTRAMAATVGCGARDVAQRA